MTFSAVARCAGTGMFGLAITSSSPAVAARCAHARAGVGAVSSQNITDPRLGPRVLDLMAGGAGAREAVAAAAREAGDLMAYRQVLAVDWLGNSAVHSGARSLGTWAEEVRPDVACAGNILADPGVPAAMADAFQGAGGHLADRLLAALRAGLDAGGEAGPVRSAGMLVVHEVPWPIIDLRVDWSEDGPIGELAKAWEIYRPMVDDYVTRALSPADAPSFGVPGDE